MIEHELVLPPEHLFPPDEWRIVEAAWSPRYADQAETVFALSNGFLGVRGTLEERHPALAPGTFVNGFHETWPIAYAEEAYGLARVGQGIAKVPDATVVELFVDDEPLFLPTARTPEYARVLDMRAGTLRRELSWSTGSGKHVTVRSCRLVSLEHRHLLAAKRVTAGHEASRSSDDPTYPEQRREGPGSARDSTSSALHAMVLRSGSSLLVGSATTATTGRMRRCCRPAPERRSRGSLATSWRACTRWRAG